MSECCRRIRIKLDTETPDIRIKVEKGGGGVPYQGEYETTSRLYESQILETQGKTLSQNITVLPIQISETTNPYGGITVVIGV